jgi:prolyl oligopeptidase
MRATISLLSEFTFMSKCFYLLIASILLISCSALLPRTKLHKVDYFDSYHNVHVYDEFKYMEEKDNSYYLEWIEKCNAESKSIFEKLGTNKKKSVDTALSINNRAKDLTLDLDGNYFYLKENAKGLNDLYYRKSYKSKEILLFDSSQSIKLGKIIYIKPNWKGTKVVVGFSSSDIEIANVMVFDLESKSFMDGVVENSFPNAFGGIDWLGDGIHFVYTYIPIVDINHDDYFKFMTLELCSTDSKLQRVKTVFSNEYENLENYKERSIPVPYIEQGQNKYAVVSLANGSLYRDTYFCHIDSLLTGTINWTKLWSENDKIYGLKQKGEYIYARSAKNHSNFEIIKIPLDLSNHKVVVTGNDDYILNDFELLNDEIYFTRTKNDVKVEFYKAILDGGKQEKIDLPFAAGSASLSVAHSSSDELWISLRGWTRNSTRFKFEVGSNTFSHEDLNNPKDKLNSDEYVIEENEYISHDGELVPISIIYHKSITKNSQNRVLLSAYGAFGLSYEPSPSKEIEQWLNYGGIYVVAHVRGGGEKGENWHREGMKDKKYNTWKDLIAAADYLVEEGYTSPNKTVLSSASGGAICVAKAITERPDLAKAVHIKAGLLNTLQYEFGKANEEGALKEFGSVANKDQFPYLLDMDPYHSIEVGTQYPAFYLIAGKNDIRVDAWHSAKYAARLKSANKNNKVLLEVNDLGHGFETNSQEENEEISKIISFFLWQTDHPDFQIFN